MSCSAQKNCEQYGELGKRAESCGWSRVLWVVKQFWLGMPIWVLKKLQPQFGNFIYRCTKKPLPNVASFKSGYELCLNSGKNLFQDQSEKGHGLLMNASGLQIKGNDSMIEKLFPKQKA